jgi:hypothetical protein
MAVKRIKQAQLHNPQQLLTKNRRYLEGVFWNFKVRVICGTSLLAVQKH